MKLVTASPTPCLCGSARGPLLELDHELFGARLHLCSFCLLQVFELVAAVPLSEYERLRGESNAQVAELNARIAELDGFREEAGQLRAHLDAVRPQLDGHEAEVLGLERRIAEERQAREEAEELASGNVNVRSLQNAVAAAIAKAWSESQQVEDEEAEELAAQ